VDEPQRAAQLEKAKEAIGRALDLLRRCAPTPCTEATRFDMSAALSSFGEGLVDDAAAASRVMAGLRSALARMQDGCTDDSALEPATAAIARSIAVLFPLCAAPTPAVAPASEEVPLPLTTRRITVEPSFQDRRGRARRDIHVELGIQSDTNFYTGFACDISSGGLFIATYDLPRVGTEVSVNFRLPGGPLMSLQGVVRWVREPDDREPDLTPGMGVAFARLSPDEARAINAYISQHAPLFFEE
jgi:uncharacterized protein (TIGR02266 family)